jgi:hypothetical protein
MIGDLAVEADRKRLMAGSLTRRRTVQGPADEGSIDRNGGREWIEGKTAIGNPHQAVSHGSAGRVCRSHLACPSSLCSPERHYLARTYPPRRPPGQFGNSAPRQLTGAQRGDDKTVTQRDAQPLLSNLLAAGTIDVTKSVDALAPPTAAVVAGAAPATAFPG